MDSYLSIFGENHPYVAVTYNNLGSIYFRMEDYAKSLECYQKSYDLYRSLFGEDAPDAVRIKEKIEIVKSKMED